MVKLIKLQIWEIFREAPRTLRTYIPAYKNGGRGIHGSYLHQMALRGNQTTSPKANNNEELLWIVW